MFFIATELGGKTVQQLADELDYTEFVEWIAYFEWRNERQEAAKEQAKRDAKAGTTIDRPKRQRKAKPPRVTPKE